jgi:aspartyl protease family protein
MLKAILYLTVFISLPVGAIDTLQLKGIFGKTSALFEIDGKDKVFRVGKTQHGITLLEVTSQNVLVDIDGERQYLTLSKQTTASYKKPTVRTVRVSSGEGGHYWVQGKVNIHSVNFVVDTGATNISMNLSTAKRLSINYQDGQPVRMSTANGVKEARLVTLKKVTIGEITQYNIAATVSLDDSLPVVLLGNSFLSGVDWRTENGVLILESKL